MSVPVKLPCILDNIRDLKDRSAKIGFVTRELQDDEFLKLRRLRGLDGWLLFALNELQEKDIPNEKADIETKTPSQRLRACIFIWWKQEKDVGKTDATFEEFYRVKMEALIEHVKKKLND